jgi:hypothetical protein
MTITVTPPCTYIITAETKDVAPSAQQFTPSPISPITTSAAGIANVRLMPLVGAPNDAGDLVLTITPTGAGAKPVTDTIHIQYIP